MSKKEICVSIFITVFVIVSTIFILRNASKNIAEAKENDRLVVIEEGKNILRQEAVTVGVARWTADEKGKPKFEWIVPVEKKP